MDGLSSINELHQPILVKFDSLKIVNLINELSESLLEVFQVANQIKILSSLWLFISFELISKNYKGMLIGLPIGIPL